MVKTKLTQKILLIFLGIFLTFISIEVGWRLAGAIYLNRQHQGNAISHKKDTYKILCLGESTTASGGVNSYPNQLEEILNQNNSGMTFSVINRGIPSIITSDILENVKANISSFSDLDMVITMMGINDMLYDYGHLEKNTNRYPGKLSEWIRSLRTTKLLTYLWESMLVKVSTHKIKKSLFDSGDIHKFQEEEFTLIRRKRIKNKVAEKIVRLSKDLSKEGQWEKSLKGIKTAIEIYPENIGLYIDLVARYNRQQRYNDVQKIYEYMIQYNPRNPWGYAGLANFYTQQNQPHLAKEFKAKAENIRLNYYNSTVRENYRQLRKIFKSHGIQLVSIQYPLLDVKPLKQIFDSPEEIIFIDNKINFKKAIESLGYGEYFKDNFAGDFGHCTKKGNRLLAENIARSIFKYLSLDYRNI